MANRRKQKKRQLSRGAAAVEDRRAEVITVAWMLSAMATFGAEVVGGLLRIVLNQFETASAALLTFPGLMLFTAAVTGIICLSLTPLVYHFRRVPPPTAVTAFAVTISVIPLAIAGVQTLR